MGPASFGMSVLAWGDAHANAGESDVDKKRHTAIGHAALEHRPHVLMCGGDQGDIPSLAAHLGAKSVGGAGSTLYHQNKKLGLDLDALKESIQMIEAPINEYNRRARRAGRSNSQYTPHKVFLLGNHEKRPNKVANNQPELADVINTYDLITKWLVGLGWDVYDGEAETFWLQGVGFRHRFRTPKDGTIPINTARSQLPRSSVWWHSHTPGTTETRYDGIVNQYACLPCYKPTHRLAEKEHNGITFLNNLRGDGSFSMNTIPYEYFVETYGTRALRAAA